MAQRINIGEKGQRRIDPYRNLVRIKLGKTLFSVLRDDLFLLRTENFAFAADSREGGDRRYK